MLFRDASLQGVTLDKSVVPQGVISVEPLHGLRLEVLPHGARLVELSQGRESDKSVLVHGLVSERSVTGE